MSLCSTLMCVLLLIVVTLTTLHEAQNLAELTPVGHQAFSNLTTPSPLFPTLPPKTRIIAPPPFPTLPLPKRTVENGFKSVPVTVSSSPQFARRDSVTSWFGSRTQQHPATQRKSWPWLAHPSRTQQKPINLEESATHGIERSTISDHLQKKKLWHRAHGHLAYAVVKNQGQPDYALYFYVKQAATAMTKLRKALNLPYTFSWTEEAASVDFFLLTQKHSARLLCDMKILLVELQVYNANTGGGTPLPCDNSTDPLFVQQTESAVNQAHEVLAAILNELNISLVEPVDHTPAHNGLRIALGYSIIEPPSLHPEDVARRRAKKLMHDLWSTINSYQSTVESIPFNDVPLYPTTKLSDFINFTSSGGCVLQDAPNYSVPVFELSKFPSLSIDPQYDCALVTAFFGSVEKTIKRILHQSNRSRCAYLVFTNVDSVIASAGDNSGWQIITTPYHLSDPRNPQDGSGHPFVSAKWYKMNAYKLLPPTIRFFFWLDGDTQVVNATEADRFIRVLEQRASIVTLYHESVSTLSEVFFSEWKYGIPVLDVYRYISQFYLTHIMEGFCERFWTPSQSIPDATSLACVVEDGWLSQCRPRPWDKAAQQVGMEQFCKFLDVDATAIPQVQTFYERFSGRCVNFRSTLRSETDPLHVSPAFTSKIIGFDLRDRDMTAFLDYWYAITYYHWQDQVSLPIAMWRFGVMASAQEWPSEWLKHWGHGN